MPKMKQLVTQAMVGMGADRVEALKAARGVEVRAMWEELMRANGDEFILQHTNNVYIVNHAAPGAGAGTGNAGTGSTAVPAAKRPRRYAHRTDGKDASATGIGKQLIVYVDESIVSAELNARRELIKLQFLQRFDEVIDDFTIFISRGRYKEHHPFKPEQAPSYLENATPIPLDQRERELVAQQVAQVDDPRLAKALERAMTADLELKKGIAAQNTTK